MGISSITRSNTDTNQLNMNTAIILLALAGCAVASYAPVAYQGPYHIPTVTADGFLLDEPAVAAAKANHFALYNQAAHAAGAHGYAHAAYAPAHYAAAPHHGYYGYIPTVTADGFLLDTPEVAAAKANHFALYNQAAHAAAAAPDYDAHLSYAPAHYAAAPAHYAAAPAHYAAPHHQGYYGYIPTVTHDGFLLDTPEVAAAKANHFALYNEAAHAAAAAPDYDVHHAYAPVHHAAAYAPAHYAPLAHHAHGYAAAGAYVPADTPAVAHANAEHFAAHAKALAAAH